MPEHWRALANTEVGAIFATILGAVIRGLAGRGPWVWREFLLSCLVGLAFALFVAPALSDWLDMGERFYGALCLSFGMTALPIARGMLALVRLWQYSPERFVGKGKRK